MMNCDFQSLFVAYHTWSSVKQPRVESHRFLGILFVISVDTTRYFNFDLEKFKKKSMMPSSSELYSSRSHI